MIRISTSLSSVLLSTLTFCALSGCEDANLAPRSPIDRSDAGIPSPLPPTDEESSCPTPELAWTDDRGVHVVCDAGAENPRSHTIVETGHKAVQSLVAYDDFLYWYDADVHVIRRASSLGAGETQTLVYHQVDDVVDLAVDATHLYWLRAQTGELRRVALSQVDGSDSTADPASNETFVSNLISPTHLWVDDTHVYWQDIGAAMLPANFPGNLPERVRIRRVSKKGDTPAETVAYDTDQHMHGMTADDTYVYWGRHDFEEPAVIRKTKDGGGDEEIIYQGTAGEVIDDLSADASFVYWIGSAGGESYLRKADHEGTEEASTLLTTARGELISLTTSEQSIYWSTREANSAVLSLAKDEESAKPTSLLARSAYDFFGTAIAEQYVYWTLPATGQIWFWSEKAGIQELPSKSGGRPGAITVDDGRIYWIDSNHHEVLSAPVGSDTAAPTVENASAFYLNLNDLAVDKRRLFINAHQKLLYTERDENTWLTVTPYANFSAHQFELYGDDIYTASSDRLVVQKVDDPTVDDMKDVLVQGTYSFSSIAVNKKHVYWADDLSDQIYRFARDSNQKIESVIAGTMHVRNLAVR